MWCLHRCQKIAFIIHEPTTRISGNCGAFILLLRRHGVEDAAYMLLRRFASLEASVLALYVRDKI